MHRLALVVLLALPSRAFAQDVEVTIRPEKAVFLQGEPIHLVVDIKNVSEYPIGYNDGGTLRFEVPGRAAYSWREQCRGPYGEGMSVSGVSHPPTFAPGQIKSFRYLLRGYRLEPGRHRIHVSGKAPVRWFQGYGEYVPLTPGQLPPKRIPYTPLDPVVGATIDREIPIEVAPASTEELRRAFGTLDPNGFWMIDQDIANGIIESAQPFHTDLIAKFASHPNFNRRDSYQALADINTAESRAHLRRLYDEESDLQFRSAIVYALSRLSHPDSLEFLASLLPGRSSKYDDSIKSYAMSGLECIGGVRASEAILKGTRDWPDSERRIDIIKELSPRDAVDIIIQRDAGGDLGALYSSCVELLQLTHYQWCDEDLIASVFTSVSTWPLDEKRTRPVIARIQSLWRPWWKDNRNKIRMYGPEEPIPEKSLPKIW